MEEKVLLLNGKTARFIIEQTGPVTGWALGYRGIPVEFHGGIWMEVE